MYLLFLSLEGVHTIATNGINRYNIIIKLSQEQYEKISKHLPRQRGNVRITNLQFLNAILYVAENGCKWRALPKQYGNWHTIYVRMNRWSKRGVLDKVFAALQAEGIININVDVVCLDSTTVKEEAKQSAGREADLLQKSIQLLRQTNLQ